MNDELFKSAAYDYALPPDQIATLPAKERVSAKLMGLLDGQEPVSATIARLKDWLSPGDLLVLNDIRVRPVRLEGVRTNTGGKVEIFVLGFGHEGSFADSSLPWLALLKTGGRLQPGETLTLDNGTTLDFLGWREDGTAKLKSILEDGRQFLDQAGKLPLPPYILRARAEAGLQSAQELDAERYQTVYARELIDDGAVAAPTAGLHFDQALLDDLRDRGVHTANLRLMIGVGTFQPVRTHDLRDHDIHAERYLIPQECADAIAGARARGGRVVAVGTTVVRALEAAAAGDGLVSPGAAVTDLMIMPGYRFQVVDALLTNFHLPKSTLLSLVCAFGGYQRVMSAYERAVSEGYRFYSYGDAMFISERGDN